jgi:sarcosine oxidase
MFRIMYSEDYSAKLAEIALALWREIETASNIKILKPEPLIFYGVSEDTPEGDLGEMKRILANLGAPFDWYPSGAALKGAFPVFKASLPADYVGLVQKNSAVIRTVRSIKAFAKLAREAKATLLTNQKAEVTEISNGSPYQVRCPAGTYSTRRLILAPSAWTNDVLKPFGIKLDLIIWQMTVAYFRAQTNNFKYPLWYEFGPTVATSKSSPRMSVTRKNWAFSATDPPQTQRLFYGFPADEEPGYIKVSADFNESHDRYLDPSQCTYKPDRIILREIGNFLKKRFKGVSKNPKFATTCLYTMSHDYQMVLDKLPGYPNVAIFTGDSGRGFKFTPLLGRVLVDLAVDGNTYYNIGPFSIGRPGIITSH